MKLLKVSVFSLFITSIIVFLFYYFFSSKNLSMTEIKDVFPLGCYEGLTLDNADKWVPISLSIRKNDNGTYKGAISMGNNVGYIDNFVEMKDIGKFKDFPEKMVKKKILKTSSIAVQGITNEKGLGPGEGSYFIRLESSVQVPSNDSDITEMDHILVKFGLAIPFKKVGCK